MSDYRDLFHDIWVKVRRQDSTHETVHLDDAFYKFLETNFPHYNEKIVTVPVSFQYHVKTHGIVRDDGDREEGKSKKEIDWLSTTSGLRAEHRIFDQIQRKFSDKGTYSGQNN